MTVLIKRVDSAEAFKTALEAFAPDVVIWGDAHARIDTSSALEILRASRPTTPFIIVSTVAGAKTGAAIRAGVESLIPMTDLGVAGDVISDALAVRQPLRTLTGRQIEVLRLLAEGNRTRAIASRLGISVKTVESHRGQLMKRLRVQHAASLVRYAVRVGLVSSSP